MKTFSQFQEDAGSGRSKQYADERIRRKFDVPSSIQISKERKLSYMLQRDLPPN